MRAAIYARFSDDTQNPRSCVDQIALCREHAERRGWTVVATFHDDAVSGFAMANRPGLNAALATAEAGGFDVLLAEDEDRIARNLEHLAHVVNRLTFARAQLATLGNDRVGTMHVAMKGFAAEDFLRNLSQKTSRGMRANAERGLATGARVYGYRTHPGGAVEIVPAEAEVIVRAHRLFADRRLSGREIADRFNRDSIPSPKGGTWNSSTILGNLTRGNGILRNELYAGVKVWNRDEVRKDPRTGKRSHHFRPPEEWKRTPVEHLRIVPEELWARTQARLAETAGRSLSLRGNERKPGLFSGLLKCGCCGSSYTSYSKTRLVCAGRREKGLSYCGNTKMVDRAQVEARILVGLRTRLLSPAAVAAYVRAYHAAWQRIEREKNAGRAPLERRLGELTRGISRIVAAIEAGADTPALIERLKAQEAEKADVAAKLAAAEAQAAPAITLHPRLAESYVASVTRLEARLDELSRSPDLRLANRRLIDDVRGLIERIEIAPDPAEPGGVKLRMHGNLALLMRPADGRAPSVSVGGPMVAGGGLEPPTCGL